MFGLLLAFHIAGATVALLSGPIPMLSRKGGKLHRRAGDVLATAMMLAAIAGFGLALLHWNVLLLGIAVLTFFLVVSGVRAIAFRRGARPARFDDALCVLTMAFCTWLLWFGSRSSDISSLFFGVGGWGLALRQWRLLRALRTDWLSVHLVSMGGAYIATVSAFLVVNVSFIPQPILFIGPTLPGTPLIVWAGIRNRRDGTGAVAARQA